MAEAIRKDEKGRTLRQGESVFPDGRYRYSYTDTIGKRQSVYSWTLTKSDPIPAGKQQKPGESLREKEKKIRENLVNALNTTGGNMTVLTLMERYIELKSPEVRETTRKGYRTQLKFMRSNPMGKRKINSITHTEAEEWFVELHKKYGKNFSTLHTLRGILRPAFERAKRDRWVIDNPFDFPLNKKRYGGTGTRDAVSRADMRRFLDFFRTDKVFSKYFYGVYILFNTGLRISEFCGLTEKDVDFDQHVIHVRRQLLRDNNNGKMYYYTEEPKTENGVRDVPMLPDVETAFRKVIANRPKVKKELVVWDGDHRKKASGFLWLDKNRNYEVAQHWQNHMRWGLAKFNRLFKDELPNITPHVCRHTFCSNCASAGMNPKTLQIIMGHSSIEFTLDVYTHLEAGDVKTEFLSMANNSNYDIYPLTRIPTTVAPNDDPDGDDEPEPDFEELPDDDEE